MSKKIKYTDEPLQMGERVPYQRMIRGLIDAYAKYQEARS